MKFLFLKRIIGRLAHFLPGGASLRPAIHRYRGVRMGRDVWIGQHVYLDELYPEAITIGDNCTLGLRTTVFAHFHFGPKRDRDGCKPVVLEDGVFVGPHCVILPGVRIGAGAVIKAGSVVTRSVPPGVFWGDAGGGPLAVVTVPLTRHTTYAQFIEGLEPLGSAPDRVSSAPEKGAQEPAMRR